MSGAPADTRQPRPFRRLFARLFDNILANAIVTALLGWWLVRRGVPAIYDNLDSFLLWVPTLLLCLVAESVLLTCGRRTPGKWLFSLHIHSADGARISFLRALNRGFAAIAMGQGAMLPLVNYYAGMQAYRDLEERGTTSWDSGRFVIESEPLRVRRFLIASVAVLVFLMMLAFLRL